MTERNSNSEKVFRKPTEELFSVDLPRCTGCRSCEVACSYHHQKVFAPYISSIKILRNNSTGEIKYLFTDTCDLCVNEDLPFCVKACAPRALRLKKRGKISYKKPAFAFAENST